MSQAKVKVLKPVVCITTLNEERTIGVLVERLRQYNCDVIVSDGGSTDDTCIEAGRFGARVLYPERGRLSIAQALIKAYCVALEDAKYELFIQMDAGRSHDPRDVVQLSSASQHDVVIGSRFVKGAVYRGRMWRAWASRVAGVACNAARPDAHIRDWTSGYRVYSRRAVEELVSRGPYKADMHGWQIETLAHLYDNGFTITEVPITYRAGRSSFGSEQVKEALSVWWGMMKGY